MGSVADNDYSQDETATDFDSFDLPGNLAGSLSGDFESERIGSPDADALERAAEAALRPRSLDEFVGQMVVRVVTVVLKP